MRSHSVMDQPQLNGLLVTKGLLDRAAVARDGTAPGEITALVLLDLAVESGAKAILGSKVDKGAGFQATLNRLSEEHHSQTGNDLEGTGRIRELRDLRNGVQHAGNTPAPEDVDRYRLYATDFLDRTTRSLLGVAIGELSTASLLRHEEIRTAIERAESAARSGEMGDAARELAVAFSEIVYRFRSAQPWRRRGRLDHYSVRVAAEALTPPKIRSALTNRLKQALASIPAKRPLSVFEAGDIADAALGGGIGDTRPLVNVLQDLSTEVDFVSERLEAAMVVGDAGEHAWFRLRVGKAEATSDPDRYLHPDPPLDAREFRRATAFVVNAATRQQVLEDSPAAAGSLRARQDQEQTRWEQFKDDIVRLAEANEYRSVLIDDVVRDLGVNDTSRVEPAITELLQEGRLVRVAPEAFELPTEP